MKKLILILMLSCFYQISFALTPNNGKEPTYCEQIVSVHGLLTRAQAECMYSGYNRELISDSAKCFDHELGVERGKEILIFGMKEFDRSVSEQGKQKTCDDLLKEFPEFIRK